MNTTPTVWIKRQHRDLACLLQHGEDTVLHRNAAAEKRPVFFKLFEIVDIAVGWMDQLCWRGSRWPKSQGDDE